MLSIRFTAGIPAAVAAEISRIEQWPAYQAAEGSAYRAAWDRLGSPYMHHFNAHRFDCAVMSSCERAARAGAAPVTYRGRVDAERVTA